MKNPNTLRTFVAFRANECDAIKEYLEEMAQKGWKLKYIRTYFYFIKIEPQTLYYSVEVFSKGSIYDTTPTNDAKDYFDYYRQAGWEFVCNLGQINIFVPESENTIPIETDEKLKLKTIHKAMLKQNGQTWFVLCPLMLLLTAIQLMNFCNMTTNYISLMFYILQLILFAAIIVQIVSFITWSIKQRRRLKQGEPIQYVSKSSRRKRAALQFVPLGIMTLVYLFAAVFSLIHKNYYIASVIGLSLLLALVVFLFSNFIQKKKLSRTANKVVTHFFALGAVFVGIMICFILMALTDVDAHTDVEGAASSSRTFLASKTTYDFILEDGTEMRVRLFKSDYDFVMNCYLYSEMHPFYIKMYEEIALPEWNAKATYTAYNNRCYIEYDGYVIWFFAKDPSLLESSDIARIKALVN